MAHDPITAVVPAFNESETIASVVAYLIRAPEVNEVIVVDNNSVDNTASVASTAGARVVTETRQGMGHAFKAGVAAAQNDWVMKVDADLERFGPRLVSCLANARAPGIGLVKGAWQDPGDDMPMTRLLVQPAVAALCPALAELTAPNSGIYLMDRSRIAHTELRGNYAVDLDAMLRMAWAGHGVAEVDIGQIENDRRSPAHYSAMAHEIMGFFLDCARASSKASST
ncbi:glycosyltransferase [Pseudohalocynthiibacter aestuariivivens]|uniref:Glycosyltransferase n=1 Tax=Roseovarius pelagicus TaxID=2980108 RepID=A0ABY6D999_9RHOB|nr:MULTISPECIES: glycosyltransferase [Rhodobacterales]QIE45386.1 glycosyltransferase [Pseudohalocynthiibacter aestuariivivens]UXX82696.1 glycosyltransferase [Roseovarius pelagicus]